MARGRLSWCELAEPHHGILAADSELAGPTTESEVQQPLHLACRPTQPQFELQLAAATCQYGADPNRYELIRSSRMLRSEPAPG